MHITAVCPGCRTSYQLSPTMRGQQMRCPISTCRTVFTVEPEPPPPPPPTAGPAPASPPPPPPAKNQRSGSVGDIVPILSAEAAVPAAPEPPASQTVHVSEVVPLVESEAAAPLPKPADAPWQEPPPVRRGPKAEPSPRSRPTSPRARPAAAEAPLDVLPVTEVNGTSSGPVELPPGQWEPPPVRRGAGAGVADVVEVAAVPDEYDLAAAAARKKKRARRLMALILLGMFVLLGAGSAFAWYAMRETEDKLFNQAQAAYKEAKYTEAARLYQELVEKFPTSGRHDEYGYLKKLSELRGRLVVAPIPAEALDDLQQFLDENKEDPTFKPYFKQYGGDFGEATTKVVRGFTDAPTIDDTTPDVVAKAEKLLAEIKAALSDVIKPDDDTKLAQAFVAVRKQHADWRHRAAVVKQIEALAQKPSADALREAKRLLKTEEARLPGIGQTPAVARLLDQMYDGHFAGVVYTDAQDEPKAPVREDFAPCILVDGSRPLRGSGTLAEGKVVLALARGVLYALRRRDGKAVWAMRVGIDTTTPPVRVPAAAGVPERILVFSADTATLTALNEDGEEVWRYRLSKPCLGRPVIVDQRAFLPTYDGQVHEVHLLDGRPIGRYQLGQRLTRGGVRQPRTPLVYFPADDSCVYVLNVNEHKCEAVLYTEHPASSLRSEPLIAGAGADGGTGGWLVLNQQAQGGDAVQLRVFELPVKPRETGELTLKRAPRLPGLTSFAPHHDGEKLAMLSDAGVLGLYGIRQARNRDDALFPWLPGAGSGAVNLEPFLNPHPDAHGRAEVVRVQGSDLWLLAHGQLQRLQLVWGGADGLRPVAAWEKPLALGSPEHASRVEFDRDNGRGTIFLVTQALGSGTCLATAVDDESGAVHWQRQLGLVCRGEPLLLAAGGGPPLVLVMDQGGGLFAFDPLRFDPKPGDQWQSGGQHVALPLEQNPRVAPLLLPGDDGASAFEIACPGDGKELVIRHVSVDAQRQVHSRERHVKLRSPLDGTPFVAGPLLVLPLADGDLHRVRWKLEKPDAEDGPAWRVRRAGPEAQGHAVCLGGDRYLTTDGSRGLWVYEWGDKKWDQLPASNDPPEPTLELNDRIIAPPLLLPRDKDAPPQVCVADSGGVVSLIEVGGNGALKTMRRWSLGGRVPAVRLFARTQGGEVRVGCVVGDRDQRRLVWLDPRQDAICWEHRASAAIVGQPEMAEGLLVIADQSGRYAALDPRTGKAESPGYVLRGSVAPAATPVAFGRGRLFAPLSDGTVLLLPLSHLRNPLRGFPLAW